jgi:DNA-binding SARP family transcriptional activator/tetratricopeptide (TPR) repeat protein
VLASRQSRMEFRILGPLEVVADGKVLDLGGPKQRALLALLLLEANRVVSSDRLIEGLWEGKPPDTALKAIQVYVSQLRKVLGSERLETKAPGYRLHVAPDELDLGRFRRLHEEGKLDEAFSLWRGSPLADLAYERFASAEIERLEELRLNFLEERIESDLADGRHAELVGELETLVHEHPLRERTRGQLMIALYQAARHTLVEELGIEPSRALRELHRAILEQDPSLDVGSQSHEEPAETASGTFVDRRAELDQLLAGLDDAFAGRGRLFLLQGEPGIGKSRLADELIRRAQARGAQMLVGRCWEAGGAPAYWPWLQSLRTYIRTCDTDTLREQAGSGASDLAQLLPELHDLFPGLPVPPSLDSEGARLRLFDAVTMFLKRVAGARPLVLVLDDLHAGDEPSLLLLQFVAREISDARLLVVCAYRDVDPSLRDPLAATLSELAREPVTSRLTLAGIEKDDVAAYITASAGVEAEAATVGQIYGETDGNPLFVGEIVRLLAAEGRLEGAQTALRIPPTIREVIGARVRRLTQPCQDVLNMACVLGREFELDAAAELSGLERDALLDVLDEALAERVLGDVPGSSARLRFAHALIRDTLYDGLTAARRLQLHRQAGEALEAVYADDLEPRLAELAHHFCLAAPAGEAGRAVEYARRAGDRALGLLAFEEAARLYAMALTLADDDAMRCDLLLALGEAQARAGDAPASRATFKEAADIAERLGLPEHLARAALGYGGRIIWGVSRNAPELSDLLERALVAIGKGDSPLRVRLLSRLAGGPLRDANFPRERRTALSEEALAIARRIGDPATLAYALSAFTSSHHSPTFVPAQLDRANELIGIATRAGDGERAMEGHEHARLTYLELGDIFNARRELAMMERWARELRQPSQDWLVAVHRAMFALLEGAPEAESLIFEARGLGDRAEGWSATVSFGLQLYVLRWDQGRSAEVEDMAREAERDYPTYPIWRCVVAHMSALLGRADAREAVDGLAGDDFAALPFDEEWLVSLSFVAESTHRLGDSGRAGVLYDRLLPYADRVAVSYPEISTGPVARSLGLLADCMERWDEAAGHFRAACELSERIGARPWLARAQHEFAAMLRNQGRSSDRTRARELEAASAELADVLGMRLL